MDKSKTIIVIGAGKASDLALATIEALKKEHGRDIIILSESEAKEKGIFKGATDVSEFKFKFPEIKLKNMDYDPHKEKNDCKKGWRK